MFLKQDFNDLTIARKIETITRKIETITNKLLIQPPNKLKTFSRH